MFSNRIANSAKFLQMPEGSQLLYFHMVLRADDDGVVEAYPVMTILGSQPDNLKVLITKGFLRQLNEDQVMVILDWKEHNTIRADRKVNSIYIDLIKEKAPEVEILEPKPRIDVEDNSKRLGGLSTDGISKVRLGKDRLKEDGVAIAPPVPISTQGTNPNTYPNIPPKPRSPREFANARRAELGKPPLKPKRTEKQDVAIQALKLIDYFKQQFYEMHGEGVDSYFRGNSSENGKLTKLAKECVLFLGSEAKSYVDDWLAGRGEFFAYDPSNAWSRSQMSKWKASKTIKNKSENPIPYL